ncbi:amidase [Achromobacter sp. Marseille-Q0513]|nr:amidase [Achromobacter sp. Marseille-Q0513]
MSQADASCAGTRAVPTDLHAASVARALSNAAAHPEAARLALLARRDHAALAEARARDALLCAGVAPPPLAGETLGVKACFDVAGWVTHAGSRVLAAEPPALRDAAIVQALRHAGATLLAQNNMTEFAYGALGLNRWHGTPLTPLMADAPRVAGGSSSGGAVAVALGMATLALGSDTSGSARIPAAFCGVAGFKPSRGRYPDAGMAYLSPSFDVPGILAPDAAACLRVDRALVDESDQEDMACPTSPRRASGVAEVAGARVGDDVRLVGAGYPVLVLPEDLLDILDAPVRQAFEAWTERLRAAGFTLRRQPLPCLTQAAQAAREGGIIAAEAYTLHRARLARSGEDYDPRVGPRMLLGAQVPAHAYASALARLRELRCCYQQALGEAAGVLTPTVPMLAPAIASLEADDAYLQANARAFSLTEFANRLDLPSVSLPGDLRARQSIGLMLTGRGGDDRRVLELAVAMERVLNRP